MIERAMKMGSVLLEAGKRSARKRATMHNAVVWACLLISLPKYVCIEFFFCWGFGFRLFVRWEYTKLFDGLPGTLDMGSIIVIKKFDVWPGLVRVDYMSCRVDLAALKGGKYVELVNLVPWKGVELQLKHVHAVGVYGWGSVCETIIWEWLEDISQNQVHKPLDIPTGASESILATRASEIS